MDLTMTVALNGVSVIDAASFVAGPYCASLLSDFGADVIKVEQPGTGDGLRAIGSSDVIVQGLNLWWAQESRNRRHVTCNLRDERGRDLLLRLIDGADVFIESFTPGTVERWGLSYEELSRRNPGLIMVRISGFGQTGPRNMQRSFGRIAQAFGGLTYLTGEAGGPPLTSGSTSLGDYLSGLFAAVGTLVALHHRNETGRGQVVELGLYESVLAVMDSLVAAYSASGTVRDRLGRATTLTAPHGQFPTADGNWIALACNTDRQFAGFARATGSPELLEDSRFRSESDRSEHGRELNLAVDAITSRWKAHELVVALTAEDVPACLVNSVRDIFEDEHIWERGSLMRIDDPEIGEIILPAPVPRLSETPGEIRTLGPREVGVDNDAVYGGILGLSDGELDALRAAGVI